MAEQWRTVQFPWPMMQGAAMAGGRGVAMASASSDTWTGRTAPCPRAPPQAAMRQSRNTHLGIASGMSVARVWACRYPSPTPLRRPYPRNKHAVGDAEIEPTPGRVGLRRALAPRRIRTYCSSATHRRHRVGTLNRGCHRQFLSISRSMPTANAGEPCRPEGT